MKVLYERVMSYGITIGRPKVNHGMNTNHFSRYFYTNITGHWWGFSRSAYALDIHGLFCMISGHHWTVNAFAVDSRYSTYFLHWSSSSTFYRRPCAFLPSIVPPLSISDRIKNLPFLRFRQHPIFLMSAACVHHWTILATSHPRALSFFCYLSWAIKELE